MNENHPEWLDDEMEGVTQDVQNEADELRTLFRALEAESQLSLIKTVGRKFFRGRRGVNCEIRPSVENTAGLMQ
ncbi:hypothetical protein [Rhodopirellula bahusiensis]|uniref:hypothetical protein n=1 Tax=Rhodopirellula bahusiensis TaxID=2014065 RepID=UPI003265AD3F